MPSAEQSTRNRGLPASRSRSASPGNSSADPPPPPPPPQARQHRPALAGLGSGGGGDVRRALAAAGVSGSSHVPSESSHPNHLIRVFTSESYRPYPSIAPEYAISEASIRIRVIAPGSESSHLESSHPNHHFRVLTSESSHPSFHFRIITSESSHPSHLAICFSHLPPPFLFFWEGPPANSLIDQIGMGTANY